MVHSHTDTIFALSSAQGRAGVSVFRVSGPEAEHVVKILTGRSCPAPRKAVLRLFSRNNIVIDTGLLLWFPGPKSFTGEDMAEFQVHGSPAVIEAMAGAFLSAGARQAEAGEFTRRGFENDRMDLTEAEAIADLIDAETEGQREQAVRQMRGGLRETYNSWREDLMDALAQIEGEIDFPDEADVPNDLAHAAVPGLQLVIDAMEAALDDSSRGEHIRHGLDIAILGPPNAGKSTLINALSQKDAAIVSPEAGTTRDIVEVHLVMSGLPVRLSDTAGLRETENTIEAEGVKRALKRGDEADIRVGVVDSTDTSQLEAALLNLQAGDILVFNKSDIATTPKPIIKNDCVHVMTISGKNTEDVAGLRSKLDELIVERFSVSETAGLTRARHRDCVERAVESLRRAKANVSIAPELAGDDMRAALHAIKELAGETDIEAVLGRIFSRFCVGK